MLLPLLLSSLLPVGTGDVPRPQAVILVLADDLGYGDLGAFRDSPGLLATPHLDQLASGGLRFTRHYAGSTVCAPSRCVLMTGLHTGHARVRGNSGGQLEPGDRTLPRSLGELGYRTSCIGKYGVGRNIAPGDPARDGFRHFFGYLDMSHAHNFYPDHLWRNTERVELGNVLEDPWPGARGQGVATRRVDYAPELFQREALDFIREHRDEHFFLLLSLNVPHANNEATRSSRTERGMEVPDLGPFAPSGDVAGGEDWPGPERGFAEMMRRIDRDVGELVALLQELELEKETLVLFSSDNGPHSEGGHDADFFDSNGQLRGKKRDLYEGGIRVPLIASWPGTITPGVSDHVSGFQDYLPTLVELSGGPDSIEGIDGISFAPTLLGRHGDQAEHDSLYWEFQEQKGKRALLVGSRWKLVQRDVSTASPRAPELYDLAADPSESRDLAESLPDRVASMLARMEAEHVPSPSAPLLHAEREASRPPR